MFSGEVYIFPRSAFQIKIPEFSHIIYNDKSGHIAMKMASDWKALFTTVFDKSKSDAIASVRTGELGAFQFSDLLNGEYYLVSAGMVGSYDAIWVVPFEFEGEAIMLDLGEENASYVSNLQ